MSRYLFIATLLLLSACGPERPDYDAQTACEDHGYKPGTQAMAKCIQEEKTTRLMQQQQREFDEMKQEQQDWTLRRY